MWEEKLEFYDALVALNPNFERRFFLVIFSAVLKSYFPLINLYFTIFTKVDYTQFKTVFSTKTFRICRKIFEVTFKVLSKSNNLATNHKKHLGAKNVILH